MVTRLTKFARTNAIALVALFIALSGAAYAASKVNSHSVKDNSLKSRDLKDGKAVGGKDVIGDSLTGAQIDESTLSGVSPTGSAGGDLTGSYPNPQLDPSKLIPSGPAGGDLSGSYPNPTLAPSAANGLGLRDSGLITMNASGPVSLLKVGPFSINGSCISSPSGLNPTPSISTSRNNSAYSVTAHADANKTEGDEDFDIGETGSFSVNQASTTDRVTVYDIVAASPDGTLVTGAISAGDTGGANNQCEFRVRAYG